MNTVPTFYRRLEGISGVSAIALRFLILTAARSGEVRGAEWVEIDMEQAIWTIPASRMKSKRQHRVPLSAAALAVLRATREHKLATGSGLVFCNSKGGQLSDMSLTSVMRRMKVEAVPHGFRSSFRDWVGEHTQYPSDVAEMALAHVLPNKTEAAYRRGDALEKRRGMMDAWASHCLSVSGHAQ